MASKVKRKQKKADFDDEEAVKREMAKVLDVDLDDLEISDSHYDSFGTDNFYKIEVGQQEYHVARNEEAAFEVAKAAVKQDLEENPEIFERHFIESHIDEEQLRKELYRDIYDLRHEDLSEEAKRRPLKFMEDNGIDIPSPPDSKLKQHAEDMSNESKSASEIYGELSDMSPEDQWTEIGEEPEVKDSDVENAAEQETEEQLKYPMGYLEDIYGPEDAVKKAIEIAGIDVDEAADEAVRVDGAGHFLGTYDGNTYDTPSGFVYWRTN